MSPVTLYVFLALGFAGLLLATVCVLSDGILQRLARLATGAMLLPRQLLGVRKIGYVVLVLGFFSYCLVWRHWVVNPEASASAVREQSRGDVHLTGSFVRLSVGGFRGITTCYLWNRAMDKQMKNQLNELEDIVGWLTELQPHFNTPWLFQSWNLAYNVSNKTDRVSDKYFYIYRGQRLLADGERQNHDDPDLRYAMGFTYQHKICQSDETNVMRSLFQLSLIPPNERDPARFRSAEGGRKVNAAEFLLFCKDHPQLVRRLREGIHRESEAEQRRQFTCVTPEAVVQFLADNYRVPSLYKVDKPTPAGATWVKKTGEKPEDDPSERFPILPPRRQQPSPSQHFFEPYPGLRERDADSPYENDVDAWDAYVVARVWYSYAQEPIPDPDELPGSTQPIADPVHQRLPRHMQTVIFRHYPARTQSYVAERLEQEGWFDHDGWTISQDEGWFPEVKDPKERTVGAGPDWAAAAWADAHKMWEAHGIRNHLLLSPAEEENNRALATRYWNYRHVPTGSPVADHEDSDDPEVQEGWWAARFMMEYNGRRVVSNFAHHYNRSLVEQDAPTVTARKLFFEGSRLSDKGSLAPARAKYEDPRALEKWKEILLNHDDFRRDDLIQEETYEIELDYLDVLNESLPRNEMKYDLGALAMAGCGLGGWLQGPALLGVVRPDRLSSHVVSRGPFDSQVEKDGTPWIRPQIMKGVLERRRQFKPRRTEATDEAKGLTGQPPTQPSPPPGAPPQP